MINEESSENDIYDVAESLEETLGGPEIDKIVEEDLKR